MNRSIAIDARALELRRDGRAVLGPLDWTVRGGERWIVMGPNGCGKSTLTQALQGRLHPWDGHLSILGVGLGDAPLQALWHRVGFAGDTMERLVDPSTTLLEYVATASLGTVGVRFTRPTRKQRERALRELSAWGIEDLASRTFQDISLGQRRMAHIARALAPDPSLLVLDEPFVGLDPVARHGLLRRLESWNASNPDLPCVLVTHHVEEIPSTATHMLLIGADGRAVASGPIRSSLRSASLEATFAAPVRLRGGPGMWRMDIVPKA